MPVHIFKGPNTPILTPGRILDQFGQIMTRSPRSTVTAKAVAMARRSSLSRAGAAFAGMPSYFHLQEAIERPMRAARSDLTKGLGTAFQKFMGGFGIKKTSALSLAYGGGIFLGSALMASHVIKSIWSNSKRNSRVQSNMQGSGYGPGYITWSKKRGMPANHLSTRGLTNALHRSRHSSII